ncbi:MAG: acyltransferase [Candidatus Electrothrix sp. AW1]|nr:acyltransferase [Candidatus Electrothrix sp. AX1]MCI5181153.1 acyltransferase [Candidatus Electrothrix gigas]
MTLQIHSNAKVSALADIEESVRGTRIAIGQYSVVDSFVKMKPVGGTGNILIGSNVFINSGCVLYSGNGIIIGDNTAIAANCVFAPVNHAFEDRNKLIREQRFKESKGGILIEEDVWIGAGCVLLDGSVLRKGCVIGAMSLVRGEVSAYSIQVGNPLRVIGQRR